MDCPASSYALRRLLPFTIAAWLSIAGCVAGGERASWIKVGTTTKDEVLARYGEPDLVRASADGDTVTYRPAAARQPLVSVPVARPGPAGLTTTQTEPVSPALGVRDVAAGTDEHPPYEVQIRYDAQGIVREVRP